MGQYTVREIIEWYETEAEKADRRSRQQFGLIMRVCGIGFILLLTLPTVIAIVDRAVYLLEEDLVLPPETVENLTKEFQRLSDEINNKEFTREQNSTRIAEIPNQIEQVYKSVDEKIREIHNLNLYENLLFHEKFDDAKILNTKVFEINVGRKAPVIAYQSYDGTIRVVIFDGGNWIHHKYIDSLGGNNLQDYTYLADRDIVVALTEDFNFGYSVRYAESDVGAIYVPSHGDFTAWSPRSITSNGTNLLYIVGSGRTQQGAVISVQSYSMDDGKWTNNLTDADTLGVDADSVGVVGVTNGDTVWFRARDITQPEKTVLFTLQNGQFKRGQEAVGTNPGSAQFQRMLDDGFRVIVESQSVDRRTTFLVQDPSSSTSAFIVKLSVEGGLDVRKIPLPPGFAGRYFQSAINGGATEQVRLVWVDADYTLYVARLDQEGWNVAEFSDYSPIFQSSTENFDVINSGQQQIHIVSSFGVLHSDQYALDKLSSLFRKDTTRETTRSNRDDNISNMLELYDDTIEYDESVVSRAATNLLKEVPALDSIEGYRLESQNLTFENDALNPELHQLATTQTILDEAINDLRTSLSDADELSRAARIGTRIAVVALLVYLIQIFVNRYRYLQKLSTFYSARANALKLAESTPQGGAHILGKLSIDILIERLSTETVGFEKSATPPTQVLFDALKAQPRKTT